MIYAYLALGGATLVALYQLIRTSNHLCGGNPYSRPDSEE